MSAVSPFARPGRGAIAVAATLAAGLAVPGVADAAKIKGTVVAKDAARGTVVTAGAKGAVTTLRTPGIKRYRIGQRVVATATAQPDGTYATKGKVKRPRGVASKARVRATVVQRSGGRYLVSAGSSTFAIGERGRARAAAAGPQPGDIVVADLRLGAAGPVGTRLREVGQASMLEVEGIFLDAADGSLRIAVERRGLVTIAVPAEQPVSATAGDEVEAVVSVAADGSFTLVALKGDGDDDEQDHGFDFDAEDGEIDVEGVITAVAPTSVTVAAGADASVTCDVPADVSVADFVVGDQVELVCRVTESGTFELLTLASDEYEVDAQDLADDARDTAEDQADEAQDRAGEEQDRADEAADRDGDRRGAADEARNRLDAPGGGQDDGRRQDRPRAA
jgi:hypothetical protein